MCLRVRAFVCWNFALVVCHLFSLSFRLWFLRVFRHIRFSFSSFVSRHFCSYLPRHSCCRYLLFPSFLGSLVRHFFVMFLGSFGVHDRLSSFVS